MKLMFAIAIVAWIGFVSFRVSYAQHLPQNFYQMYLDKLNESNYNSKIAPVGQDGPGTPIRVLCTMHLLDVHKIDNYYMEYRASFYFRQKWNDSRLAYVNMDSSFDTRNGSIYLNDEKKIWTPDLFFVQEKDGAQHGLTTPNVLIKILPDGEVLKSVRLSVTFSCDMDFRNYPLDSQKCEFHIESFSHSLDKMVIDWDYKMKVPVSHNDKISVLNYELDSVVPDSRVEDLGKSGIYKILIVTLTFNRKIGFYMTRLFVPFIILVILSWISFWIKAKLVVIRLSLLLAIMYIMLSIGSDINFYIPPAPYTKASDVWIAVCESLVFAAFLEFIIVSLVTRSEKKLEKKQSSSSSDTEAPMTSEKSPSWDRMSSGMRLVASRLSGGKKLSGQIDGISRIIFPLLFVLFNFIYWLVY